MELVSEHSEDGEELVTKRPFAVESLMKPASVERGPAARYAFTRLAEVLERMEAVLFLRSESRSASVCRTNVRQPTGVPKRTPFDEKLAVAREMMLDCVAFAAPQKANPGVRVRECEFTFLGTVNCGYVLSRLARIVPTVTPEMFVESLPVEKQMDCRACVSVAVALFRMATTVKPGKPLAHVKVVFDQEIENEIRFWLAQQQMLYTTKLIK
jgi:hypothetical protein